MFLREIEGSPSLEIVNLVLQRRAAGEKIVSLAVGDPSFPTPKEIVDAAHDSMLSGDVHYTSSLGIPEFREAARDKVRTKNGINAELDNTIFITTKYSVYASLFAIASKDDFDVLVPDPGYFYSEPVILAGGKPVRYMLNPDDFSLDLEEVRKRVTSKTKAIFINSPSNPTSHVMRRKELEELYSFCQERKIYIISDEAYEDLTYEAQHVSCGSLERQPEWVISIFSLSKSYSMTGWRAGYLVANSEIIRKVNKLIEHTYTCFPPFIQKTSSFALKNCGRRIKEFKTEYEKRRDLVTKRIAEIDGLSIARKIEGAFYAFPGYSQNIPSVKLARLMIERVGVALLPGIAFGQSGERHLRISFSSSPEEINEGMDRVSKFFSTPENLS